MRFRSTSRLVAFTVAGVGLVIAGAPPSQAADPFVAGGRSARTVAVAPPHVARTLARAANLAKALDLPGVTHRTERLDDRFDHLVYDEVVAADAAGRDVSIARFDTDGRVVMAVDLGWRPRTGRPVGREVAVARGNEFARAAGLTVSGPPTIIASAGAGGWSVSWPRTVDGVPVLGDGVRVSLWNDGSFHALSRSERPLASPPIRRIPAGGARQLAISIVAQRVGGAALDMRPVATALAWVAPNDTWAPSRPDAPAATLRLAWIVRFEAGGRLADRLRSAEYWIDAGHGTLIGGDLAE